MWPRRSPCGWVRSTNLGRVEASVSTPFFFGATAILSNSILQYDRPYLYPKQHDAIFTRKRWSCVEASTKSGKTVASIAWIVEGALGDAPGDHSWWVAPVSDQAQIAFKRIKAHLTPGSFTSRESPVPTINLINGADISFRSADNPDSLYGEDVKRAVLDEASRQREDAWHAVRSTLTATRGPAIMIGNVKGRRNWFYEFCRRIESGKEPNGHYAKITWRDAVEANVLDLDEIDDARRNLPENVFKELYEAEASDDSGNPFGEDHIYKCVAGLSNLPPVAYGLDLAKKKDYLVLIGLDEGGRTCHFSRWQGVSWRESIRRIHDIVGEDIPCLYDSTGIGDPVGEELQADGHGNFRGYNFTAASKQRLMEGLAVSIQGHEITFPDGPIKNELLTFEYDLTRTGVRYSAPEGYNDDCVCGLALAREQWTTTAPGASMIAFIADQTKKARAEANAEQGDLVDEEDEFVRRFAHVSSEVQLDNELTELYTKTMAEYDAPSERLCARCTQMVSTTNRVSDGFNVWHPECAG